MFVRRVRAVGHDTGEPIPTHLPVLPLRDIVVFPYMVYPVLVGRRSSLKAATFAVDLWLRKHGPPDAKTPVVLSALGVILIGVSGWLGGEMVYVHGVAVEAPPAAGRA